jgi:hypothetical protein
VELDGHPLQIFFPPIAGWSDDAFVYKIELSVQVCLQRRDDRLPVQKHFLGDKAMEHEGILFVGRACGAEAGGDAPFDVQSPGVAFVYHHNISCGVVAEAVSHVDVG